MKNVIHIFGASGSGTTTLGKALSERLGCFLMDSDDYYWMPTDPKFTVKRDPEERVRLMREDLGRAENAVISGSVANWGNALIPEFTLAVRLVTGTGERIRRLRAREYENFGDRILPGGDMYEQHEEFIRWAAEYDRGDVTMRSSRRHDEWQKQLPCPLLILSGTDPVEENVERVLRELRKTDVFEQVERNIDGLVEKKADWTASASPEEIAAARTGDLKLYFWDRELPKEWLRDLPGKKVLCLAGAGGLQAPLLAAAGAEVSVIDLSSKMLEKDRETAEREGLSLKLVKGNICDLSAFGDGSFDLILNPPSLMYVPDLKPVYRECGRVLRKGGELILMAPAPVNYLCDWTEDGSGGFYKAVHRMPWCSLDDGESDWVEYGHTMEEYLGGLTENGFSIEGYAECQREDITELMFSVRAVKR